MPDNAWKKYVFIRFEKLFSYFRNILYTPLGFLCIMPLPAWGEVFQGVFSERKTHLIFEKKDVHS